MRSGAKLASFGPLDVKLKQIFDWEFLPHIQTKHLVDHSKSSGLVPFIILHFRYILCTCIFYSRLAHQWVTLSVELVRNRHAAMSILLIEKSMIIQSATVKILWDHAAGRIDSNTE